MDSVLKGKPRLFFTYLGLVVIDYIQQKCLLNMGTADLYGSNDPYQRMPCSPRHLPDSDSEDCIVKVQITVVF